MPLSDQATPEELIIYTEELAWGKYGEPAEIYYSKNTIFRHEKDIGWDTIWTKIEVCWYVSYLLWIWLTNFPGCSEKDSSEPKQITTKTIQEFKKRTAYLLPKLSTVKISEEQDASLAA